MPAVSKQPKYGYIECYECKKLVPLTIKRDLKRKKYCSNDCKNKVLRKINRTCKICSKKFKVQPSALKRRPCNYCSRNCSQEAFRREKKGKGKMNRCVELAKKGYSNREIHEITGYPMGSVGSYLNKANYRRTKTANSYSTIAKRIKKDKGKCEICGFSRTLDAAHIVPASKGGAMKEDNIFVLCPNHHRLFDKKKLTKEEAKLLSYKLKNYEEYTVDGGLDACKE